MKPLILKKNEDRRLRRGHLWVFSNEVENLAEGFTPGEAVQVLSKNGRVLGVAYVNPHSLICARLLTRDQRPIDRAFVADRVETARAWRDRYIGGAYYRLFYSEADGFPGLIIDRYGDHLVVQAQTRGAYERLDLIVDVLREQCAPQCIVLRNDAPIVELEGLETERRMLHGKEPAPITFELDGIRYCADLWNGQKTGFYFDQRENRLALTPYVAEADVLDAFCYSGAWGLTAARAGARSVLGIDSSAHAIQLAQQSAELNEMGAVCRFEERDVFDALRACRDEERLFDVVCVDPPPYARQKSHLRSALEKYEGLNAAAIRVMRPGGVLVTCSCSGHVQRDQFEQRLVRAAGRAGRRIQLLEFRGQARDHPVLLPMRETAYLKCAILQVQD